MQNMFIKFPRQNCSNKLRKMVDLSIDGMSGWKINSGILEMLSDPQVWVTLICSSGMSKLLRLTRRIRNQRLPPLKNHHQLSSVVLLELSEGAVIPRKMRSSKNLQGLTLQKHQIRIILSNLAKEPSLAQRQQKMPFKTQKLGVCN